MHPKQICADVQQLGAKLVLDGDDLYIENPEKIYPEAEDVIKSYKGRIVKYLKGEYSDKDHAIHQTVDKVLLFMSFTPQDMNDKINDWLQNDIEALTMVMQLTIDLNKNGWSDCKESPANYETDETDNLSYAIYKRAMTYFSKAKGV